MGLDMTKSTTGPAPRDPDNPVWAIRGTLIGLLISALTWVLIIGSVWAGTKWVHQ